MAKYKIKLLNLDMIEDAMKERFVSDSVETRDVVPVCIGVRSDNFALVKTIVEKDAVYIVLDLEHPFWSKLSPSLNLMFAIPQGKIKSSILDKNGVKTIQACTVETVEILTGRHVDSRIGSIGAQILDETIERVVLSEDDVDE